MSGRKKSVTDPVAAFGGLAPAFSTETRRVRGSVSRFGGFPMGTGRGTAEEPGIADMRNLSPRYAPALATRRPRTQFAVSPVNVKPHGMAMLGDTLYFVWSNLLYRAVDPDGDGRVSITVVGVVSDTDKQMAVHGDRLLIFPDKKYVDKADGILRLMELDTGAIPGIRFDGSKATLPAGMTWWALGFRAGDGIHIINADDVTPAPEGHYRIRSIYREELTIEGSFPGVYISGAVCRREIPELSRVCVMGNRVYGIAGSDIYISAAGSGFCWSGPMGEDGAGPTVLHTDTPGELTALAPWQGYVVFFKGDRICRLLGSRVDELSLMDMRAPGIPASLAGTLCEVGGMLYYCSGRDVYRYNGTYPERVGLCPADRMGDETAGSGRCIAAAGVGGTDGVGYYLSLGARVADAADAPVAWRVFLYMPDRGEWFCEDGFCATAMLERGGALLMQDEGGTVWQTASEGQRYPGAVTEAAQTGGVRSEVTFAPIYADGAERLRITDLSLQATAQEDAELWVDIAYADGRSETDADTDFREVAHFAGPMKDRMLCVPLMPVAADSAVIRLRMRGEWVISRLSWERFE